MESWLSPTEDELGEYFKASNEPPFRAKQFRDWLHAKRVPDFARMKNLPAALREKLSAARPLRTLRTVEERTAEDALTSKWLLETTDGKNGKSGEAGNDLIECVLIIEKERTRRTVCVSCMVGCPLACAFCATGGAGFTRNLTAGEIIEQAYMIDNALRANDESGVNDVNGTGANDGVSHVVFMGMGEPLLNYDAVIRAAETFTDPAGMGLSGRHVTISTAGIPEGIARLAASGKNYRLAVSLHAPNQSIREQILPVAKRWPLAKLLPAIERFAESSSRDITFEYCLIDGVNALEKHAKELATLIGGFRAKVNLIPMNAVHGAKLHAPPAAAVRRFQEILEAAGISAPVRMEKGADIGGACGQLRAERVPV